MGAYGAVGPDSCLYELIGGFFVVKVRGAKNRFGHDYFSIVKWSMDHGHGYVKYNIAFF
jgi:hypothetical protein